jgi:hypothetical protein
MLMKDKLKARGLWVTVKKGCRSKSQLMVPWRAARESTQAVARPEMAFHVLTKSNYTK